MKAGKPVFFLKKNIMNEKLKKLIIKYMNKNDFDIWELRQTKVPNPFPVGTQSIYNILKDKEVSFKNKKKLFEFFGFRLIEKLEKI